MNGEIIVDTMEKDNVVFAKSKKFAVRIIKLQQYLNKEKKTYELSKQILRSGTSIGANIAEAECSISKKEFLSKMYIAYKECVETKYWLELLLETEYISITQFSSLMSDCTELEKLLSSITKSTRESI